MTKFGLGYRANTIVTPHAHFKDQKDKEGTGAGSSRVEYRLEPPVDKFFRFGAHPTGGKSVLASAEATAPDKKRATRGTNRFGMGGADQVVKRVVAREVEVEKIKRSERMRKGREDGNGDVDMDDVDDSRQFGGKENKKLDKGKGRGKAKVRNEAIPYIALLTVLFFSSRPPQLQTEASQKQQQPPHLVSQQLPPQAPQHTFVPNDPLPLHRKRYLEPKTKLMQPTSSLSETLGGYGINSMKASRML